MGTSKAKINDKVKDLLKDIPIERIDEKTIEISKSIISIKNLKKEFLDEESMEACVETIQASLSSLVSNGFNGKSVTEIKEDKLSIAEFIESVINELDKDDDLFVGKDILEKSFKITMAECINEEIINVETLLLKLLYNVIKQLLLGDLNDTIKLRYEHLSFSQIEKMAINVTNQIMNDKVNRIVKKYIEKSVSFDKVLKYVTEETKNVTFGEF